MPLENENKKRRNNALLYGVVILSPLWFTQRGLDDKT